ncbi:dienelactone hydrolase family protein [Xylanimonas oleitrophica]|uniref:Dienelactone hydrolase family protein n=1 Tax=Xylanimonas oleitrophica TaxID=2607479 RepID=A0A2W5WNG8_9MICO|nr:dienelactone hydrolase family protein [Xylanimonas oleitrophica]PZR52303.1 dienelactone hydrolase family protein [Xylanimonas oleitrophica]
MTDVSARTIDLDGFSAYRAVPPEGAPIKGGLVLVHEIWGLVEHIKDVAARLAAQGYVVVAPDVLSHGGVTPQVGAELERLRESGDEEERTRLQPRMREALTVANQPEYGAWAVGALRRVVDHLLTEPGVDGRVGVTGFCFGGSYTFALAAADQRVRAAAPFYGAPPAATDYAGIACPVRAFYGREDPGLMEGLPQVEAGMREAGVDFEATVYDGAGHAFFNDTNSRAYHADAASDAWRRLLAFLDDALSRPAA